MRVARRLLSGDGIVLRYTNLNVTEPVEKQIRKEEGGTHAEEIETSMMLYIAPESVEMKKAVKDYHPSNGPLTRDPNAKGTIRRAVYGATQRWLRMRRGGSSSRRWLKAC